MTAGQWLVSKSTLSLASALDHLQHLQSEVIPQEGNMYGGNLHLKIDKTRVTLTMQDKRTYLLVNSPKARLTVENNEAIGVENGERRIKTL